MKLVNSISAHMTVPTQLMQRCSRAVKPIATDEGEFLRWNADPFTLDGGSGTSEADPGDGAKRPSHSLRRRAIHLSTYTMSFFRGRLLHLGLLDGEV
jgi:hypothetical protein